MEQKTNGINDTIIRSKSLNTKDLSTTNNIINHDDDDDEIDDNSTHIVELNNRIKNDFMSYCLSFLREDEEGRECVQVVWDKYLQCVGDVSMVNQKSNPNTLHTFLLFRYPRFSIHFHSISKHLYFQNIKMKFLNGVEIYFILIVIHFFIQHIIPKHFHA
jgi:hypothetical protein